MSSDSLVSKQLARHGLLALAASVPAAPISDVPVPTRSAIHDEPPSELTPEQVEAALEAERTRAARPPVHLPGLVETRWRTVEEAREYRAWLEKRAAAPAGDEDNWELTRGERKILRMLQRDPRTRNHPTDPLEFKRIADARVKRRDKDERRAKLARLSAAGSKARARALPRPTPSPESVND
ncbi:MAG: hypothetical protein ACYC0B_01940 [Gemmatimonadaceae bacterium]